MAIAIVSLDNDQAMVDASSSFAAEAASMRAQLQRGQATPASFRRALTRVDTTERDAWVDAVFGIDEIPDDGPELPQGCVPYLPASVDVLLRMVDLATVRSTDVFVDVGSGLGRAAALTHFLTGASAIGVEIQSALVRAARELVTCLRAPRICVVEGDAAELAGAIATGTVFFLYCPFSGSRLARLLDELEAIACARTIRVCCVDLPLPPRPWLSAITPLSGDLTIYRSTAAASG